MIKIYNTLTKKKEEFEPLKDKVVKFYHCGPTVYWTQHIGNLRGMVMADLINRSLRYLGYKVKLARNYTDVGHLTSDQDEGEDKIAKGAQREGLSPQQIAQKYIKIFEQDVKKLNILEPEVKPLATKHVKEMIDMVKNLLAKGYAYTTDLAVYFDVSKTPNYNQLSGKKLEEQIKGAGKGDVEDPGKKHAADFALWFFKAGKHKNALQTWFSPFESSLVKDGEGFPGWHIECSAMSKKYLGKTIDIHLGGVEHIPVHHTNEIAQSEAANEVKFVNYWLHNEHLTVDNGKMAKSEGTGYSLQEIEDKGFEALALRYFFLQAHYRSKQNFTWQALEAAQNGYDHLKNQILGLGKKKGRINAEFKTDFIQAISDDFNIPQALAVAHDVLKSDLSEADKLATILDFDQVLGLNLAKVKKEKIKIPAKVIKLVEQREAARAIKDWDQSDKLRDKINQLGYQVEDTNQGQVIKKIR
ncbi:MAG: cysteine--tRNA ligase [Candidatus Buchananbacteria bacterium]|nr:cysteine--tRNA ligase [Candidatus Buchananbacteria bacterium]